MWLELDALAAVLSAAHKISSTERWHLYFRLHLRLIKVTRVTSYRVIGLLGLLIIGLLML
jgi:hypothetical protein